MRTELVWNKPADLLPEFEKDVLTVSRHGSLIIMQLFEQNDGDKVWYYCDGRAIYEPDWWAYVEKPGAIASHKDGELGYVVWTKNASTGDRTAHEFKNLSKAMHFGHKMPEGVDGELRRCFWALEQWHEMTAIAPSIVAAFDKSIFEQERAIAP